MNAGARIDAEVTARHLRVRLAVPPGQTLALVGPNGAGKSTVVQLLSGELRPDEGTVDIDGRTVATGRRASPPHDRDVALLAQRPLLFPHLSVLDNVAFGPRAHGTPRPEARARALAELDAVGCGDLARRRPEALSGGQAQRVALARALATDPAVVLLDEPLASLDVDAAAGVRTLLADRLAGRTAVLVTHEVLDLWTLADVVAVLEDGRVVATGTPDEVLSRPATAFVAGLGQLNRLVGRAVAPDTVLVGDVAVVGVPDAAAPPVPGAPAMALMEPAAVALYTQAPEGSPRNRWPSLVTGLQPRGSLLRVSLQVDGVGSLAADVTPRSVAGLGLAPGVTVVAVVKAAQVRCARLPGRAARTP